MVGDKGKKPVSKACPGGVCVMRMSYGRRREQKKRRGVSGYKEGLEHRTYHCQNLTAYPASAVNFCSDVEVQYPHLRIYRAKFAIYVKYCCQTHECNKDFDTIIMLPTYQTQNENRDQIYFDYAIIYTELIVVAAVALWPLVILLQDRKEERKLYAMLNAPMEKYVIEMALAPAMKTTKVSKTVTGQLSFWDLCRELTNMELRIRKPCVTIKPGSLPFYHKFEHVAGGNGHKLVKVERVKMPGYESFILTQLVEHGPYMYDWKPFEMVTLFSQAADIFEGEPTMLTLRAPITIIGDIRGQYQDLHRWLCIAGFPPRQKVLFLGGVIDSDEPGSLDCLAFIAAMKVRFPHDVFYIRGIGETLPIRFQPRFRKRNDFAIQSAATRLCNNLPLAARISNQILAVHSGLSHELSNYECIEAVKRPFTLADMPSLAKQLIFSEPTLLIDMYRCGTELSSAKFGLAAVNRVCRDMGVKLIVRARNPLKDGICWLGRRQRLISLWSAPAKETSKSTMELPYFYYDPNETHPDISRSTQLVSQARLVLANEAVSEEQKKVIYEESMAIISDVNRYYKAKSKKEMLQSRDKEMDEELLKVEMEVARKERENLELASSNEMRKLKIRMSQMSLMRSQQRISYLRRRRKELEEEQKRLSILVEQENAFWTEKLQSAREKQARFQQIMDRSPRLAKLRSEQEAVKTLTTRVEQLTLENDELKKEAARLEKELELETAAPMRVFVVNFAKVALRIYEMRDKLAEARRINKQLQAEEAEMRQKMGAANYDMFDTTFMSQDMALTKVPEHTALSTEVPKVALPATLPEAAEEENASVGASNISDGSHTSQLQLPQTTEQDVLVARANAVNNYVVQQAESVARANEPQDNDSGEMTRDEDERESVHNREPEQCPGVDIEVTSVADEERAQIQEDVDMNGTVEEHDAVLQEQEIEPGDFSDDDGSAMDATTEDVEQNATMDEDDNEEAIEQEEQDRPTEPTSPFMPKVDRIETQAATKSPMSLAKESPQMKASSQRIAASSQMSQQSQHDAVDVRTPGSSNPTPKNVRSIETPSTIMDPSQEPSSDFFNNLMKGPPSPVQGEVNFNFNVNGDNNDFDPTEVLNISTNSNDPGADFLSLMKSENEKKEKQRKGSGAGAADFSFSVFGMPAEGGSTEGGGGFDFNFGDSTQGCEGGGGSFQFNFGESTDDQGTTGGGGGGFNLFGF